MPESEQFAALQDGTRQASLPTKNSDRRCWPPCAPSARSGADLWFLAKVSRRYGIDVLSAYERQCSQPHMYVLLSSPQPKAAGARTDRSLVLDAKERKTGGRGQPIDQPVVVSRVAGLWCGPRCAATSSPSRSG